MKFKITLAVGSIMLGLGLSVPVQLILQDRHRSDEVYGAAALVGIVGFIICVFSFISLELENRKP